MLSIRLQRTGRKSHAMFRIVVQDSRRTPTSGKIVASLGSYNPHTKDLNLDVEKAKTFLNNGAQPTPRIVSLFKSEKITMPSWVEGSKKAKSVIKHPEKLRKNQPKVEKEVETVVEDEPKVEEEVIVETESTVEGKTEEVAEPTDSTKKAE